MFERFTDRARRVVVLAQEEARLLSHNYIGTEHILLGLVREGESIAARALDSLGVRLDPARQQVESIVGLGKRAPSGHIPFTPRAKKGLELSLREALQLSDSYIGPEHILLGLLREGDSVAVRVLVGLGTDLNRVRQQVIRLHQAQVTEGGADPAAPAAPRVAVARPGFTPDAPGNVWQLEVLQRLSKITDRLEAIEQRLGIRGVLAEPGEAEPERPGDREPEAPGDAEPERPGDREPEAPGDAEAEAPGGE
jgi:ATP-dependent Clp protease ATP-binding subunit ClpC